MIALPRRPVRDRAHEPLEAHPARPLEEHHRVRREPRRQLGPECVDVVRRYDARVAWSDTVERRGEFTNRRQQLDAARQCRLRHLVVQPLRLSAELEHRAEHRDPLTPGA